MAGESVFPKSDGDVMYADDVNTIYDISTRTILENAMQITCNSQCAGTTEVSKTYVVSDTMIDATGYNNTICTGDTTSIYNATYDHYTNCVISCTELLSTIVRCDLCTFCCCTTADPDGYNTAIDCCMGGYTCVCTCQSGGSTPQALICHCSCGSLINLNDYAVMNLCIYSSRMAKSGSCGTAIACSKISVTDGCEVNNVFSGCICGTNSCTCTYLLSYVRTGANAFNVYCNNICIGNSTATDLCICMTNYTCAQHPPATNYTCAISSTFVCQCGCTLGNSKIVSELQCFDDCIEGVYFTYDGCVPSTACIRMDVKDCVGTVIGCCLCPNVYQALTTKTHCCAIFDIHQYVSGACVEGSSIKSYALAVDTVIS